MYEREKLEQELKEQLQWVQYRLKILDIMEKKLSQMRSLAERSAIEDLSANEREEIGVKIKSLESQVNALDSESRKG